MLTRYIQRQQHLLDILQEQDIENLLVFNYENILYLTGYSGNAAYLIVSSKGFWLITDYRYFERAKNESFGCELICRDRDTESLGVCIKRLLPKGKTAFESSAINVALWSSIEKHLNLDSISPLDGSVEKLRIVKDEYEIASIKKAAAIADLALSDLLTQISVGVTELDLATELDYKMKKLGSDGVSFDTILLFAQRSALPHGKPGETQLKYGDLLLVDFGAVINGYRSDMTRTYVFGEANSRQQDMYDAVLSSQITSLNSLKAGLDCQALNNISTKILTEAGYGDYAGKGLGHGVGLALHEVPFINPNTNYKLEAGNIITIEPGVYIPQVGGVRIEDDVLITESGFEFLTHAPKSFVIN